MKPHDKLLLLALIASSFTAVVGCASGGSDEGQGGTSSALVDATECRGKPMPDVPEGGVASAGGRCQAWKCNYSLGWMPVACTFGPAPIDGSPKSDGVTDKTPAKGGDDTLRDKMSDADPDGSQQQDQVASADPPPADCSDGSCGDDDDDQPAGGSTGVVASGTGPTCDDPSACAGDVTTSSLHLKL
jgi:hypothetical protein